MLPSTEAIPTSKKFQNLKPHPPGNALDVHLGAARKSQLKMAGSHDPPPPVCQGDIPYVPPKTKRVSARPSGQV